MWVDKAFDRKDDQALDQFLQKITGPPGSKLWNYFHYDDSPDPADAWTNRRTNILAAISIIYHDFQVPILSSIRSPIGGEANYQFGK